MNTGVHQYEDKLLDYAYGELPANEAAAVDAHVRTCAKCSHALAQIKGVRSVFAPLPMTAAPEAGLESLLAYAEQHARRAKKETQAPWRRWVFALASAAGLLVIGVVAVRASKEAPQSASDVIAANEKTARKAAEEVVAVAPSAAAPVPVQAAEQERQQVWDERQTKRGGPPADEKPAEPALDLNYADARAEKLGNKLARDRKANEELAAVQKQAPSKPMPAPKTADTGAFDPVLGSDKGGLQGSSGARQSESKRSSAPAGGEGAGRFDDFGNAGRAVKLEELKEKAKDATKADVTGKARERSNVDDQLNDGAAVAQSMSGTANRPGFGVSTGSLAGPVDEVDGKKAQVARAEAESATRGAQAVMPPPPPTAQPSSPAPQQAPMGSTPMKKSKAGYGVMPRSAPSSSFDQDAPVAATESIATSGDAEASRARDKQLNVDAQLAQARSSANSGDRRGEVMAALKALQAGASGYSRAEALKRACDGFEALGEYDRAQQFCSALISEFPGTAAARQVVERKKAQLKPKAPARSADAELNEKKPAEDLPAAAQ
ncbi:MAG: zf-HC2 domain-containing protein [Myxococcaceae bacterium]|nr:zf-HC2 domain-containing protein [Myxococcaceae bacterium]